MKETAAESYNAGFFFGSALGDKLIHDQMATGGVELELREEAHTAVTTAHTEAGRREAAWRLGVVRGFREEVR